MLSISGMFCPHLLKAFTHLQITSIPAKYVLKRYSRDARFFIMWDRHDIVTMGPNYTTKQSRTTKLVELAMAVVRACCRSATGFDRGCDDLAALAMWAEAIPGDSGPSRVVEHENNQNVENETREGSRAPQIANDSQISDYAPKEVRTKGRKRGAQQIDNGDEGTTQGIRVCSYCGGKGHYITGCKLNPDNAEKQASKGMRGLMGRKRGRPPTKRHLVEEFDEAA